MNITLFTRPKSVLTVGLALLLAFDPNLIFQWTGLVLGDAGTLLGRILGLVYLGIAIELWFVRSNSDLPARNALLLTAVDCSVVALLVQVQLAGLMNVLGWGLIAVYLGSGLGFLWCHASRQEWRRTRKPFLIQAICTFLISPDSSPFVPSALLVATGARGRLILSTTRISCRRT